jgi:hypothetical protein
MTERKPLLAVTYRQTLNVSANTKHWQGTNVLVKEAVIATERRTERDSCAKINPDRDEIDENENVGHDRVRSDETGSLFPAANTNVVYEKLFQFRNDLSE